MRSRRKVINAIKSREFGQLPTYIRMAHRHFEKEGGEVNGKGEIAIPIDFVRLFSPEVAGQIDEICLGYNRKSKG